MGDVKVTLRLGGLNALMTSPEVSAEVVRHAEQVRSRAGAHFGVVVSPHRWTARAYVKPVDYEGMRQEALYKVLTGALNAAG